MTLVIVFGIWIMFYGLSNRLDLKDSKKWSLGFLAHRLRVICQNLLISLLYCRYGDFVMFSVIEFRSIIFRYKSSTINFLFAIIFLLIGLAVLLIHLRPLLKRRKLCEEIANQKASLFLEQYEGFLVFFRDLKEKYDNQRAYLLIFYYKRYIS